MKVPLHGSLKAPSTMNGRRQALSYGRMGIVRFTLFAPPPITDGLWFRSGVRQDHSLVGDTPADLC